MRLLVKILPLSQPPLNSLYKHIPVKPPAPVLLAIPVRPDQTFGDLWEKIETRYKKNYLPQSQHGNVVFKKFQDNYNGDLDLSDTVGEIFGDEPDTSKHLIHVIQAPLDRDISVPVTSNLRPPTAGHKRRTSDVDHSNARERKRHESQYRATRSDVHPDQPVRSRESSVPQTNGNYAALGNGDRTEHDDERGSAERSHRQFARSTVEADYEHVQQEEEDLSTRDSQLSRDHDTLREDPDSCRRSLMLGSSQAGPGAGDTPFLKPSVPASRLRKNTDSARKEHVVQNKANTSPSLPTDESAPDRTDPERQASKPASLPPGSPQQQKRIDIYDVPDTDTEERQRSSKRQRSTLTPANVRSKNGRIQFVPSSPHSGGLQRAVDEARRESVSYRRSTSLSHNFATEDMGVSLQDTTGTHDSVKMSHGSNDSRAVESNQTESEEAQPKPPSPIQDRRLSPITSAKAIINLKERRISRGENPDLSEDPDSQSDLQVAPKTRTKVYSRTIRTGRTQATPRAAKLSEARVYSDSSDGERDPPMSAARISSHVHESESAEPPLGAAQKSKVKLTKAEIWKEADEILVAALASGGTNTNVASRCAHLIKKHPDTLRKRVALLRVTRAAEVEARMLPQLNLELNEPGPGSQRSKKPKVEKDDEITPRAAKSGLPSSTGIVHEPSNAKPNKKDRVAPEDAESVLSETSTENSLDAVQAQPDNEKRSRVSGSVSTSSTSTNSSNRSVSFGDNNTQPDDPAASSTPRTAAKTPRRPGILKQAGKQGSPVVEVVHSKSQKTTLSPVRTEATIVPTVVEEPVVVSSAEESSSAYSPDEQEAPAEKLADAADSDGHDDSSKSSTATDLDSESTSDENDDPTPLVNARSSKTSAVQPNNSTVPESLGARASAAQIRQKAAAAAEARAASQEDRHAMVSTNKPPVSYSETQSTRRTPASQQGPAVVAVLPQSPSSSESSSQSETDAASHQLSAEATAAELHALSSQFDYAPTQEGHETGATTKPTLSNINNNTGSKNRTLSDNPGSSGSDVMSQSLLGTPESIESSPPILEPQQSLTSRPKSSHERPADAKPNLKPHSSQPLPQSPKTADSAAENSTSVSEDTSDSSSVEEESISAARQPQSSTNSVNTLHKARAAARARAIEESGLDSPETLRKRHSLATGDLSAEKPPVAMRSTTTMATPVTQMPAKSDQSRSSAGKLPKLSLFGSSQRTSAKPVASEPQTAVAGPVPVNGIHALGSQVASQRSAKQTTISRLLELDPRSGMGSTVASGSVSKTTSVAEKNANGKLDEDSDEDSSEEESSDDEESEESEEEAKGKSASQRSSKMQSLFAGILGR
ncbi:hypothetical protein LTR50_001002 [Elasticomyces elasticus]|nr:hypothetical protein LTR50_001002 [Elasticomyces elasticus]